MPVIFERWTPNRKRKVAKAVMDGRISFTDAVKRWDLSVEELNSWLNKVALSERLHLYHRSR